MLAAATVLLTETVLVLVLLGGIVILVVLGFVQRFAPTIDQDQALSFVWNGEVKMCALELTINDRRHKIVG